jgi:hypothetical protein
VVDLSRTAAALKAYDEYDETVVQKIDQSTSYASAQAAENDLEALAREVGFCFGLDTYDRNNIDDCQRLLHPGPKIAPPGGELSFVRRMVKKWEEENG